LLQQRATATAAGGQRSSSFTSGRIPHTGTLDAAFARVGPDAGPSHAFEEHIGEARLRLRAPSLPGLFEEAARALAELMGSAGATAAGAPVPVHVHATDRDALLAAWIDELVFLSETRKRVWTEAQVERATDTEVSACVRGVEPLALRTQVKAATLHDLHVVEREPGAFEATVVLDV
jgi:SHS2 domain-containing protein